MKRKALLCVLLALILLFSTQPAAALTSNQRSTVIEGTTRLPVIHVLVPGNTDVFINPLQLPVRIDAEERYDQILCKPVYLLSVSDIPLRVDVSVTGEVREGSDMILASSPTGKTGSSKQAFIYLEMQQSNVDDWEYVRWDPEYDSTKHIVITDGGTTNRPGMLTLPPLRLDGELPENAYAWFRLSGDAVREPTNWWNSKDGVNVTVAFTFTPLSYS